MQSNRMRYNDAAQYLGIAEYTLRRWASEKRIAHYKVGKAVFFKVEDLDRFIDSGKVAPIHKRAVSK